MKWVKIFFFQLLKQSASWNCQNRQTSTASEPQDPSLTELPAKALEKRQASETCWKFHHTEDELREVNIQPKIAHIQTQAVVHQTCSEPVKRGEEMTSVQPQREESDVGDLNTHQTRLMTKARFLRYVILKMSSMLPLLDVPSNSS